MNVFRDNEWWVEQSLVTADFSIDEACLTLTLVNDAASAGDRHDELQRVYCDELAGDRRSNAGQAQRRDAAARQCRRRSPRTRADRPRRRQVGAAQREPTRHTPEAHVLNTRNSQASGTGAVTI
jgi:hypothetical protein